MAKRIRFTRFKKQAPLSPLPPSSAKQPSKQVAREQLAKYNRQVVLYNRDLKAYRREKVSNVVSNSSMAVRLMFRIAIVALALGFIFILWNRQFEFHTFMQDITSHSIAPFDFPALVSDLNTWVNGLPSWLDWAGRGVRAIAMLFLSMAYTLEFLLSLIVAIFVS